jgi:hypothetical protein
VVSDGQTKPGHDSDHDIKQMALVCARDKGQCNIMEGIVASPDRWQAITMPLGRARAKWEGSNQWREQELSDRS